MSEVAEADLVMFETVLQKMRGYGYAVVAFTPEELEGADPEEVEDRLVERGWEIIHYLGK